MKMRLAKMMIAYCVLPQVNHQLNCFKSLRFVQDWICSTGQNESVEHCQQKLKAEHDASAQQTTFLQGEFVYACNFSTGSYSKIYCEHVIMKFYLKV